MDKEEIQKRIEELNKQIAEHNNAIISLREEGLKLIGKLELLDEQSKETPKKK